MRRNITSSMTAVNKVVILGMFGVFMPVFAISAIVREGFVVLIPILIFWAPFAFFLIRWALRLTQVELTESGLIISRTNFGSRKEIFVRFDQIKHASQHFFQRGSGETVTIEFAVDTEFGRIIKFMPKTRFLVLLEHPIVDEINGHLN